jgi:hypothetical protein
MEDTYLKRVREFYPNADRSEVLAKKLIQFLCTRYNLAPKNIMTANSICSDDVNAMQFPHAARQFLGPFNMGGLNGFPFTGLTGMSAFSHHVPDNGALLIFYAPHIGIPATGVPGEIKRIGQVKNSPCCGAAAGAMPVEGKVPPDPNCHGLDFQMETIKKLFYTNRHEINRRPWPIINATEVMYRAIDERISLLVSETILKPEKGFNGKYLFMLGGIFINGDENEGSFAEYRSHRAIDPVSMHQTDLLSEFFSYHKNNQ